MIGRFLRLWGSFGDPYTWLIWACIFGVVVVPAPHLRLVLFVVEVITVAMRIWTRDVRAADVAKKKEAA